MKIFLRVLEIDAFVSRLILAASTVCCVAGAGLLNIGVQDLWKLSIRY